MNNEIKQFKVQANDPYFTANKWNESLDYSINFEKMIKSILGPKFKGIYKISNEYNNYDYVWYDNNIFQILEHSNLNINVANSYNLSNVYKYKNGLLGLNKRKEIVYQTQFENILINNSFDFFCYDYHLGYCYAVKDNRIYEINLETKESKLLKLVFSDNIVIEKILCDEGSVYFLGNNNIYKSIFSNDESTLFETVYEGEEVVDFDIAEDLIFVVGSINHVEIVKKTKDSFKKTVNMSFAVDKKVKITALNNNTFAIFDGKTNVYTYFNNGSGIYNLESNVINYSGFSYGVVSMTKDEHYITMTSLNNTVVSIPAVKYSIEKVNINYVLNKNTHVIVDPHEVSCHLAYKDGYYTFRTKDYLNKKDINFTYSNYLPTIEENDKISYDFSSLSFYSSIMVKIKTTSQGKDIGRFVYNNKQYIITLPEFNGNQITFFLEPTKEDNLRIVFITDEQIIVKELIGVIVTDEQNHLLDLQSEFAISILEIITFVKELSFSYRDYLASNSIMPIKDIIDKPATYAKVHFDFEGNLPLKVKDNSIVKSSEGFYVNMADDIDANSGTVALSTAGANIIYKELNKKINDFYEDLKTKIKEYEFSDLKNIPIASNKIQGITSLAYTISDSTITAATPKAVKDYISSELISYNHPHPYLNIETGGAVNGPIDCNNITSLNIETININSERVESKNGSIETINSTNAISKNLKSTRGTIDSLDTTNLKINGYFVSIVG